MDEDVPSKVEVPTDIDQKEVKYQVFIVNKKY
jgi:hypothetical protein